jgi:membrane protein implicated in regulation of membrane protease activity
MENILSDNSNLWLIAGGILIILDFIVFSGVGFLFAGLGALVVGALLDLSVIENLASQWIVFFASTTIWAVSLWKPLTKYRTGKTDGNYQDMVGHKAVVVGNLEPNQVGQAKWSGTIMRAKLDEAVTSTVSEGTKLEIVKVEGNLLTLK